MSIVEALKNEGLDILFKNMMKTNTFGEPNEFFSSLESALTIFITNSKYLKGYDFPIAENEDGLVVQLAGDNPNGPALYLVSDRPGIKSPPHIHDTWAIIVGIRGIEENIFYKVIDDPRKVHEIERYLVVPGVAFSLMPSDIHSTETKSEVPTHHLHLYGKPLHSLRPFTERTFF